MRGHVNWKWWKKTILWEGNWVGPYEFVINIFVLFGASYTIFGKVPQSIQAAIPSPFYRDAWSVLMTAGSLLVLIGLFWSGRRMTAYTLEQIGALLVGTTSWIYVVALYASGAGINAIVAGSYVGGIGFAALVRAGILSHLKHELLVIAREMNGGP